MNNEEFLKEIKVTDEIVLSDLYEAIDDELNKPKSKQNSQIIIELSQTICEIEGVEATNEEVENGKVRILSKIDSNIPVKKRILKVIPSIAAGAAAVFILNVFTIHAFNVSIFPKLYERANGGIVIYFDQDKIETEENLNFIRNKCQEYGINELIPTYFPNGYSLSILNDEHKVLRFSLEKENIKINLLYKRNNKSNIIIPSDTGDCSEEVYNDHPFLISKEDDQYRAVTLSGNWIFKFTSYDLDYKEAQKIIKSLI